MTNEQLAEQMQELIDFRDVTLAGELCDDVWIYGGELTTKYVSINPSGQEWMPEVVHAKHVDSLGNTRRIRFMADKVRYHVEIDE